MVSFAFPAVSFSFSACRIQTECINPFTCPYRYHTECKSNPRRLRTEFYQLLSVVTICEGSPNISCFMKNSGSTATPDRGHYEVYLIKIKFCLGSVCHRKGKRTRNEPTAKEEKEEKKEDKARFAPGSVCIRECVNGA